jgi:hypothetical protein
MSLLSSLWFSPFSIYALALPLVSAAFIVIGFILALGAARQSRPSVFEARIGGPFRGQVVQLKGAGLPVVLIMALVGIGLSLAAASSHRFAFTLGTVSVLFVGNVLALNSYLAGDYLRVIGGRITPPPPEANQGSGLDEKVISLPEASTSLDNLDPTTKQRSVIERTIGEIFASDRRRIVEEIQSLTRRGNLNLSIGMLISMIGISLLLYLVTRPHDPFKGYLDALTMYLPRITTVALVETFAYFFLQLYRRNLEDIKYYQNELTTLSAKQIAWRATILPEGLVAAEEVIKQIVGTERNPPAKFGQDRQSGTDLKSLLEILETVNKVIVQSAKEKS